MYATKTFAIGYPSVNVASQHGLSLSGASVTIVQSSSTLQAAGDGASAGISSSVSPGLGSGGFCGSGCFSAFGGSGFFSACLSPLQATSASTIAMRFICPPDATSATPRASSRSPRETAP